MFITDPSNEDHFLRDFWPSNPRQIYRFLCCCRCGFFKLCHLFQTLLKTHCLVFHSQYYKTKIPWTLLELLFWQFQGWLESELALPWWILDRNLARLVCFSVKKVNKMSKCFGVRAKMRARFIAKHKQINGVSAYYFGFKWRLDLSVLQVFPLHVFEK